MVRPSNLRTELLEYKDRAKKSYLLENMGFRKLSSLGNQGSVPTKKYPISLFVWSSRIG